ncbi:metalloregulator ArsR/SmtB family transcription factor [Oscillatoria laete-virens NRMC-F 0139]|nr:metalloregulator ArsR/SmtB family transcription factor [Oscillatoria laete-virens]MDL5054016.1 metalloregulator ArsR/SmtB family transcription factor [Oscillatoria laete-virens NRMC-F 0139]
MKLIEIYHCLCDETRLRILNLLSHGPLCVCHIQDILGLRQVNASKHLHYLKKHGLAESFRCRNWTVYSLPAKPNALLRRNLECLQDCLLSEKLFHGDIVALRKLHGRGGTAPCGTPQPGKITIPNKKSKQGSSSHVHTH